MKVYRWEETENQHIAIIRPDELFDLSEKETRKARNHEYDILAKHIIYNEMLTYAKAYDNGCNLPLIQSMIERAPDVYLERDMEAIGLLKQQQRKTA